MQFANLLMPAAHFQSRGLNLNETKQTRSTRETMWLILQQGKPEDYVIGTGETHSVKEFLEEAFTYVKLDWTKYAEIDPRYFRPIEVESLLADPTKARKRLGWQPKVTFSELVRIMVDRDMELIGLDPIGEGKRILQEKGIEWTNNQLTARK